MRVPIEIRPGELIDRLTILRLKSKHMGEGDVRTEVARDLAEMEDLAGTLPGSPEIDRLANELSEINARLWDLENEVRRFLNAGDQGSGFSAAAARIFRENENRSATKARIDHAILGVTAEEKSFR